MARTRCSASTAWSTPLNEHKDGSPQQILDGMHASVNAFVGEAPQFDDLTMHCLELKEKG